MVPSRTRSCARREKHGTPPAVLYYSTERAPAGGHPRALGAPEPAIQLTDTRCVGSLPGQPSMLRQATSSFARQSEQPSRLRPRPPVLRDEDSSGHPPPDPTRAPLRETGADRRSGTPEGDRFAGHARLTHDRRRDGGPCHPLRLKSAAVGGSARGRLAVARLGGIIRIHPRCLSDCSCCLACGRSGACTGSAS